VTAALGTTAAPGPVLRHGVMPKPIMDRRHHRQTGVAWQRFQQGQPGAGQRRMGRDLWPGDRPNRLSCLLLVIHARPVAQSGDPTVGVLCSLTGVLRGRGQTLRVDIVGHTAAW